MTKPRILITSDIGGSDKDDAQSLVHALLYADKLRIEGIVSSPAPHGGRTKNIIEVIDAYAKDYANLKTYSSGYPTPDYLKSITFQGATTAQPSAGWSSSTAGSKAIVDAARKGSAADPLYVLAWGALTDVAQALRDAPDIVDKIRLLSIGSTNVTFDPHARNYIFNNLDKGKPFEKLWWIESNSTFRGMYVSSSGANDPSIHLKWIDANAAGHGALGDYFKKMTVDLYGPGSPDGLKMGDTPSLLYLLDTVDNNNPAARSWGGSFVQTGKAPNYWTDSRASEHRLGSYDGAKTVFDHRGAYLSDFAARLDRAKAPADGSTPTSPSPAPAPAPTPPSTTTSTLAKIGVGTTEAETLTLSGGYARESSASASGGAFIKANGTGEARGAFTGTAGSYKVDVRWLNEDDGVSSFALKVNGATVGSWTGTGGTNNLETRSFTLNLKPGDVISIAGTQGQWEHARVDWIKVSAAGTATTTAPAPAPAPAPVSPPPPSTTTTPSTTAKIGVGTTEAETLNLSGGYARESSASASGGSMIKANGAGEARGAFTGTAGSYKVDVRWLNEDDGVSSFALKVNGATVGSWTGTGGTNNFEIRSFTVNLKQGDVISIAGTQGQWEHARVDWIKVSAAGTTSTSTSSASTAPVTTSSTSPTSTATQSSGGTTNSAGTSSVGSTTPSTTARIGVGTTEAETLNLSGGYARESNSTASGGAWIKANGAGEARGAFTGTSGSYKVDVRWLNEDDGASSFALKVNGSTVGSWTGTGGTNNFETRSFTVNLKQGDVISIAGTQGQWEHARVDWIKVSAAGTTSSPTPAPTPGPAPTVKVTDYDFFAFAGQSNAAGHFFKRSGDTSGGALGNDVFEAALSAKMGGGTVTAINAASSGSGSNEFVNSTNYWWHLGQNKPGPALLDAVSKIKAGLAAGKDLDGIIWAQGETDAKAVNNDWSNLSTVLTRFDTATKKVFDYLQAQFGRDVPIFIQELGTFPQVNAWLDGPVGALDQVREVQSKMITSMPDVFLGAKTAGLAAFDSIHFNNAAYGQIGKLLADSVSVQIVGSSSSSASDFGF